MLKAMFLKYITGKLVAKTAWAAFKITAKYTENLWDDAVVAAKEGLESGDFDKVEKAIELINIQIANQRDKKEREEAEAAMNQ